MQNLLKSVLVSSLVLASVSAYATKGVEDGSKFGTGEDSIRCLENLSLYASYYKIKDYDAAYKSWKVVFDECPQAGGRTMYMHGAFLITNQMAKETDPVKKKEWFNLLMESYNKRVQYTGNDTKYPEVWIRGRQAMDYIAYSGASDNEQIAAVLDWLKAAVDAGEDKADADVLSAYFQMLEKRYQTDKATYQNEFIAEYLRLTAYLDRRIALNDKYAPNYIAARTNVNNLFVASGAADCVTLENVFANKVEQSKDSFAELGDIISLFRRVGCKESDVYFQASMYAHKLNPTAETAAGCGYQAIKKKEYAEALTFFEEALLLEQEDSAKYDYQLAAAHLLQQLGRFSEARVAARKAAALNSHEGEPYILIATMYADNAHTPYPDDKILAKTVYWAAVDQLEKAKSVDPACAEKAQQLINSYRKYYPSKEDVFFKPELKPGESFTIGGWIGESVRCRD